MGRVVFSKARVTLTFIWDQKEKKSEMTKFKGKIRVIFMVLHTGRKSPYLGNVKVSKKKMLFKASFH